MDNPFPKGRATEVKTNSAYNYLLMSKTSKETNEPQTPPKKTKKTGELPSTFVSITESEEEYSN